MSLVLTAWTPVGFVMAADARFSYISPRRVDDHARKIISWPEMRAAVGFAGVAVLPDGRSTDAILEMIMRREAWPNLATFAEAVAAELGPLVPLGARMNPRRLDWAIKVHVAGMEPVDGRLLPSFYYVRNTEWTKLEPRFKVNEDLRTTVLQADPVVLAGAAWVSRWSGEHIAYAARAQASLEAAASRLTKPPDVAAWADQEIRRGAHELARLIARRSAATRRWVDRRPFREAADAQPRMLTIGGAPRVVVIHP